MSQWRSRFHRNLRKKEETHKDTKKNKVVCRHPNKIHCHTVLLRAARNNGQNFMKLKTGASLSAGLCRITGMPRPTA